MRLPITLKKSLIGLTFFISMMIYFRAGMDESTENNESAYNDKMKIIYLGFLSFFAGIYESLEIFDHLFPKELLDGSDIESLEDNLFVSSKKNLALVAMGMGTLATPLLACIYAHKLQGDALAKSLGAESEFWGLVLATPQLVKFCAISIPHLFHTLNGTRERFSLSVTNNEVSQLPRNSLPSLKWWAMLIILIYLHLPEGNLIAAPLRSKILKHLAALGFALAESVPHINQLEQLPNNIADMLNKKQLHSFSTKALSLSAGAIGGFASASEALIAAYKGTRNKAIAWIPPLVEFVIGFSESQQHLVPIARSFLQNSIFKSAQNKVDTAKQFLPQKTKYPHK